MDTTLLIATTNAGKIREMIQLLTDIHFRLITLSDIGYNRKIDENGKTFEENAKIKAETIGKETGYLTIAEDSGLEIDALGGRPGIFSARYTAGSDGDRNKKILDELRDVPQEKRTARFIAAVVLYDPGDGKMKIFRGVNQGYITGKPKGTNGFGYDPIFFNLKLKTTNGEAALEEKNKVSHRAEAFRKLKEYLKTLQ